MVVQLTKEWLEFENTSGGRMSLHPPLEPMQKQWEGMLNAFKDVLPGPDPDVKREDKEVEGIKIRIYTPPNPTGNDPVGVHAHGGGFALGDLDTELLLCDAISHHGNAVVVSVDYRLAPQHKHPSALEDCMKIWRWAWENFQTLGGDRTKYFSFGTSAGGNLALSIANAVVKDASTRAQIKGCLAIIPAAIHPKNIPRGFETEYRAYKENSDAPVIDETSMNTFFEWAGTNPLDEDNFTALATKNHPYFPKTHFVACDADPLRDDAIIMQKLLEKAGVQTSMDFYKGLPHAFWAVPVIPESAQVVPNLLKGLQFVLS